MRVRKEIGREKGRRASKEEMRKRTKKDKVLGGWEEERKEFWEIRKWKIEEVEELREKGYLRGEELWERERGMQREKRWEKIKESKSMVSVD